MSSIVAVSGPREAGPGERELMLARAREVFAKNGITEITRIDVPAKGTMSRSDGGLRTPIEHAIPALQSGSLFGDRTGILIVNAQSLLKVEAGVLAELVSLADGDAVVAVFVSFGAIPAPLGATLKDLGTTIKVKRLNERSALDWVTVAARDRELKLPSDAVAALISRFGTDIASLGQALDQLVASGEEVTGDSVRDRFRNRPDEPSWFYMDALASGDRGEALRRLGDFLFHGHPLTLLAVVTTDLRRRALAASSADYESFVELDGGRRGFGMQKVWRQRKQIKGEDLRAALRAVAKADIALKTSPEPTHRVTMDRLTVALCRWYGGVRR